jgi:hypothetical protein
MRINNSDRQKIAELLQGGMSNVEVARLYGINDSTVSKIKKLLVNPPKNNHNESICWNCGNAYPSKCEWIRNLEHIWKRAEKMNSRMVADLGVVDVYRVKECDNFTPDSDETRIKIQAESKGRSCLRTCGILRGAR